MSEYLTEEKAAEYIGFSIYSLRKWRNDKTGPDYTQPQQKGGSVRYTKVDLDRYMESKKVKTTSQGA